MGFPAEAVAVGMSAASDQITTTEDRNIFDRQVEQARNWASERAERAAPDLVLFGIVPKTARTAGTDRLSGRHRQPGIRDVCAECQPLSSRP